MRDFTTKIHAIIGMAISVVSFGLLITSLILGLIESPTEFGLSNSFSFWVLSVIVAMISLLFYIIDALLSIVKAFKKVDPIFNSLLSILLFGAVPMVIFVSGGTGINIYIWNAYYLTIFVLEIVSLIKHIKMDPKDDLI